MEQPTGLVSTLYGRAVAPERPLYCNCGLAFDTAQAREEHWARPMRTGGPMRGRKHGPPRAPGTAQARGLMGPLVRDHETIPPPVKSRRKTRVRAPTPDPPIWKSGGRRGTPTDPLRPPPTMPGPPLPRDWARDPERPGCTAVQSAPSPGTLPDVARWRTVFDSGHSPEYRILAVRVRTADRATVSTLRRRWNREGRWIIVAERPDPEHGTLWRIEAGPVRQGPRRPSSAIVGTHEPIQAKVTYYRLESR